MLTLGGAGLSVAVWLLSLPALLLLLPPQLNPVENSIINERDSNLDDNMIDFIGG
jgi:hypothetical protein